MIFINRVLKNYSTLGAVSRSSKFLNKKMISPIDFKQKISIIELGAGDGVFSDSIINKMSIDSKIAIFEIDSVFVEKLKQKYINDSRVIIYDVSACQMKNIFKNNSIDYIISSLPFAFMNKKIVGEILETSKNILKKTGKFVQYQYFLQNKKQIHHTFSKVDYKFTPLNFPPAFIYICKK